MSFRKGERVAETLLLCPQHERGSGTAPSCQPPGKDVPSSSNATRPPERMAARKGMRNGLLKPAGNIKDTGWIPPILPFQPLPVLPSSKGRCHTPRITTCCSFHLSGARSSAPVFPPTQAQASPGPNFPAVHQLEKPEQPKLLDVAAFPGEAHEAVQWGGLAALPKSYRTCAVPWRAVCEQKGSLWPRRRKGKR